ncbi:hypothetical protein BLSTO_05769 [Blastocystis sp. subtype 1]
MENNDCYSLTQFLEHKDYMTIEQLREIARGCLLGLKYLHKRGIMHGDVRPVNLFLTEDGVLKLGYYGLTTQAECYSIKEADCEGVRSFAPEVFEGEYKMKSDVWSLGIALIEMMGMRPYDGYGGLWMRMKIRDCTLPFKEEDIESEELIDFLKKCFLKKEERWSVNALLNHPFLKECEEEVLTPFMKILKNQEYCEWIVKTDGKDAYLMMCKNDMYWYEGLIESASSMVEELCLDGVIEVDVDSHALLHVNGKDVNAVEHNRVLDLSDDGERWEGNVLDNKPCGWGVLYDSENRRVYEGFRIGDVNVCYGRSYYPENQKVEYEGEIYEGMRWGRGTHYDRNGSIVFEGEWMNNEPVNSFTVTLKS